MTPLKNTLIAFCTSWGSKLGGINCFNFDFLMAFQAANYKFSQTVCVVLHASPAEIAQANREAIILISLDLSAQRDFPPDLLEQAIAALKEVGVTGDAETVWLGHDRITGAVALAAASLHGGRAALIHHMNYGHYEAFSENSDSAYKKETEQKKLFRKADIVFAIGPLLRDCLIEMLDHERVFMLIPGMAQIEPKKVHRTFKGFLSGRLSPDAKKVKQAQLGIAAFANALKQASENSGFPAKLRSSSEPKLTLRGVDFENESESICAELNLQKFASDEAGRVFTLHALPYTTDRDELFEDLTSASVAMMPSWHEGFGLVAWEAIAAGVPLILSEKSGVYHLLKEIENSRYTVWVTKIDVAGDVVEPYFQHKDKVALAQAIIDVANDLLTYQNKAAALRVDMRLRFSWKTCAEEFSMALGWGLQPDSQGHGTLSSPVCSHTTRIDVPLSDMHQSQQIADLAAPEKIWRSGVGMQSSRLLRAEEEIIPFDVLREPFLNLQMDWACNTAYPIAIRLITGAGGVGKTRLALELCNRLHLHNWQAGLLRSDFLASDAIAFVRTVSASGKDCCVILDYAETRQEVLLALLKAVLVSSPKKHVRLLLLARDGGEWWAALPRKDVTCAALLEGMACTGPYPMPHLHDSEQQRLAAYQLAISTFAGCLEQSMPDYRPELGDEQFSYPLFSQMAALMALHGERPKTAVALPDALVNHERRYWKNILASASASVQEQEIQAALLMVLASLIGNIATVKDVEDLWLKAGGTKELLKPLFNLLRPLYPGRQGLEGLRPDLLGESLIGQILQSTGAEDLLNAVFTQKSQRGRRASLTVLARMLRNRDTLDDLIEDALVRNFANCAHDLVSVCIETPSPLPKIVEAAYKRLGRKEQSQVAGLLEQYFEYEIVPLTGLEVLVKQTLLAKAEKAMLESPKREFKANYGSVLRHCSMAFRRDGRLEEALNVSSQCLEIHRKLSQSDHGNFKLEFSRSLSNHSSLLAGQGHLSDALTASSQALEIGKELAQTKAEIFEVELASLLNSQAVRLAELGRLAEALAASNQALELWRKLAQAQPERFEMEWSTSLHNQANLLEAQDQLEDALIVSSQALEIRQRLAQSKPASFETSWASSLSNHSGRLAGLGYLDEALAISSQALEIRQRLALAKPERFESDWAASLHNHAILLAESDQWADVITLMQQCVVVYKSCVLRNSKRFVCEQAKCILLLAFFRWLATPEGVLDVPQGPVQVLGDARQQAELNFLHHTLGAFSTPCADGISTAFSFWQQLDSSQKQGYKMMYLVLCASSEHHFGTPVSPLSWRELLQTICSQRQNLLPAWMNQAAQRLGFTFSR